MGQTQTKKQKQRDLGGLAAEKRRAAKRPAAKRPADEAKQKREVAEKDQFGTDAYRRRQNRAAAADRRSGRPWWRTMVDEYNEDLNANLGEGPRGRGGRRSRRRRRRSRRHKRRTHRKKTRRRRTRRRKN